MTNRNACRWASVLVFPLRGIPRPQLGDEIARLLFCLWSSECIQGIGSIAQTATTMQIHIGHIIRDELHRQSHTNQWLADQLSVDRSTVQRLFNKPSIDTQQLLRISKVLGKDMFVYYSQVLNDVADVAT